MRSAFPEITGSARQISIGWRAAAFTSATPIRPQALCTPARGSLFTGVYPHTTRLDHNLYKVDNAFQQPEFKLQPNLPTLLRQAGYRTGYIGKWHLGEVNPGLFDYWNGYNSLQPHWMGKRYESAYRSDVETDDAVRFLEENRVSSLRPVRLLLPAAHALRSAEEVQRRCTKAANMPTITAQSPPWTSTSAACWTS